jgi:hypothetical protein
MAAAQPWRNGRAFCVRAGGARVAFRNVALQVRDTVKAVGTDRRILREALYRSLQDNSRLRLWVAATHAVGLLRRPAPSDIAVAKRARPVTQTNKP